MLNHKSSSTAQACGAQLAFTKPQYQQIKVVLDVHAPSIVEVLDDQGAKPRPRQILKPADFITPALRFTCILPILVHSRKSSGSNPFP